MTNLYERARADGSPEWSEGTGFGVMWDHVFDQLRFHRGQGFVITDRRDGSHGPARRLNEVEALVAKRLDDAPEMTVLEIRSESDGFAMVVRRDHVPPDPGQLVVKDMQSLTGLPYEFGWVVSSGATDCSGLTMWAWNRRGVDGIPHNAAQQYAMFGSRNGFVRITRSQLQIGDPVFCDGLAHVATYFGMYHGHPCVIDTEPHDTGAPAGWPTSNLGVGVRIRPMDGNYYCADITGMGRIVAINGKP